MKTKQKSKAGHRHKSTEPLALEVDVEIRDCGDISADG